MRLEITESAKRLQNSVVAIPTETVYGLAASLYSPDAIESIFILKGRPRQNPLIVHLASVEELPEWVEEFPQDFEKLSALWPGPLTLILPCKQDKIPDAVRAGLPTAAFRIPALSLTRELLTLTGPLVVPSANLSGRPSSTSPEHVEEDFGEDFPVLDGGDCEQGLESTILAFKEGYWRILRQGALSQEYFKQYLGYLPEIILPKSSEKPECPGQLYRHYAPQAKLKIEGEAEVILGFKERNYDLPVILLGSLDNPEEVAHNLYHSLRELDERKIQHALVDMNFPSDGLWSTLRERLTKAML